MSMIWSEYAHENVLIAKSRSQLKLGQVLVVLISYVLISSAKSYLTTTT